MKQLLAIVCVIGCASPGIDLSAEEQTIWNGDGEDPDGEVIEVEGTSPFDPNWEGPGQGAPGNQGESSGGGASGGGGGGTGSPGDDGEPTADDKGARRAQPQKKICDQQDKTECMDCCDWNADKHDAWACNRMPKRTKEEKDARRRCWEKLEQDRSACYRDCPQMIITIVAP